MALPGSPEETGRILDRWKAGESDAADLLVERHTPLLRRRARRLLSGRADVGASLEGDDLIQDTWVRVFSKGALERLEIRRSGAFSAWLVRVLQRSLLDRRRRTRALKRDASVSRAIGADSDGAALPGPEVLVDSREPSPTSRARMHDLTNFCQHVLTDREWEVWKLVEIDRWAAVDVAREKGISSSAVRSLTHRAREKLLRALSTGS